MAPVTALDWEQRGARLALDSGAIFVVDLPAAGPEEAEPLLILHGFPTCSYDWHQVVDTLRGQRRVVLLDHLGFGLSDKPDRSYTIALHADNVVAVAAALGLERVAVASHDMGNTVGAELLARSLEDVLPFEITRRVLTNGNLYIEKHPMLPSQKLLLSLDDARLDLPPGGAGEGLVRSLEGLFGRSDAVSPLTLEAERALVSRRDGHALLPRTIRYLEDRQEHDARYSAAIETHPSPLALVWGDADPVAGTDVPEQLRAARPDAGLTLLDGVGHYPMLEAPDRFAAALASALA